MWLADEAGVAVEIKNVARMLMQCQVSKHTVSTHTSETTAATVMCMVCTQNQFETVHVREF